LVNFLWFTPNEIHNMHSGTNRVAVGDAWLASWVPTLLAAMAGKRALFVIWFDEAYTSPP